MEDKLDYMSDATIDESALDVEWLRQASLAMKYGRIVAQAKLDEAHAKENFDLVKAEVASDVRINPGDYDLKKVTEGTVAETVTQNTSYKKAMHNYLDKKFQTDMAINAMRAIEQKKVALENLVRLHGQQYFAGPSVPRDLSKEWEQGEKRKMTNQKVTLRRKKRTK